MARERTRSLQPRAQVSLWSRLEYDDAKSLCSYLTKEGFRTETVRENPINISPEVFREITVNLWSIADNAIGALIASIITWAVMRKRELNRRAENHVVVLNISGENPALRIAVNREGVKLEGEIPTSMPRQSKGKLLSTSKRPRRRTEKGKRTGRGKKVPVVY